MFHTISFKHISVFALVTFASIARSEDCSQAWQYDLKAGPTGPKAFNGDTNAAYAAYGYYVDEQTVLRLKGSFPRARFFSVESYRSTKSSDFDVLLDGNIKPDHDSVNPFVTGASIDAIQRDYTVDVAADTLNWSQTNVLKMDHTSQVSSVWIRYYAPHDGVTISPEDIPTIEAIDAKTGQPKACPKNFALPYFTQYPQALTVIVPKRSQMAFKLMDVGLAGNNAIPGYAYGASRMKKGDVIIARFKAPSFSNTQGGSGPFVNDGNVRYWSMCSHDIAGNKGLACLPDHSALIDQDQYVTVALSSTSGVEAKAKSLGMNFLPDLREKNQTLMLLAYRNILPSASFKPSVYKGVYNPMAVICSASDFIKDKCDLSSLTSSAD